MKTKANTIERLFKILLATLIAFSSAAFKYEDIKAGDVIQLNTSLNGRGLNRQGRVDFRRSARNVKRWVKKDSVGSVLEVRRYGSRGSLALKIRLEGPQYARLSERQRSVWVFDSARNENDFTKCVGTQCDTSRSAELATSVRALSPQPGGRRVEDVASPGALPDEEAPEVPVAAAPVAAAPVAALPAPRGEEDDASAQPLLDGAESITDTARGSSQQSYQCGRNAGTRTCMVCNCFFESGSEPLKGKVAVSLVVLARTNSSEFPSENACGIIYQPSQFSWTPRNGRTLLRRSRNPTGVAQCEAAVDYALQFPNVRGPTFFYNPRLASPSWARTKTRVFTIENHRFMKTPGTPSAFTIPGGQIPTTLAEISRSTGGAQ